MEKYGRQYKQARQEKLESVPIPACEVTYNAKEIETHHNQPKMFDGVDVKENLIILCKDFHSYLHQVCNVQNGELVHKRKFYAKKIYNDINGSGTNKAKKQLEEIDDVLMREYIQNMILGIQDRYREKVLELTLLSQMKTIRELNIQLLQAKEELATIKSINPTKKHER